MFKSKPINRFTAEVSSAFLFFHYFDVNLRFRGVYVSVRNFLNFHIFWRVLAGFVWPWRLMALSFLF